MRAEPEDAEPGPPPSEVADRVRRYRARLGPGAQRVGPGETITADVDTESVLAVGALPQDQQRMVDWLASARTSLAGKASVRIIDETRLPLARRPRRRRSTEGACERDVPAGVRDAGWTIASIERIDVEGEKGGPEMWVDLLAIDLRTSRERDGDEGSE